MGFRPPVDDPLPYHRRMQGAKVLVTGVTGQVAAPVAQALAADNEVWGGIARFTDTAARDRLSEAGVRCHPVNMASGEFTGLPSDFEYVLNFAVAKSGRWDKDLAANAEAAGLLMAHCRDATAFLHCSSAAVYDPPGENPPAPRQPHSATITSICSRRIRSPRSPARPSCGRWPALWACRR